MPSDAGRRVRDKRKELGLTLDDVSTQMQLRGFATITNERVSEIEHGRRAIKADELVALARILRVPITWLLGVPDQE